MVNLTVLTRLVTLELSLYCVVGMEYQRLYFDILPDSVDRNISIFYVSTTFILTNNNWTPSERARAHETHATKTTIRTIQGYRKRRTGFETAIT